MQAIKLRTNHLTAPLGIDGGQLFLSWQCTDGVRQTAYEIQLTANGLPLWESGKVASQSMHADTPAVEGSRLRGCWKIRLWDEADRPGPWSEARFETGLAAGDWQGLWVDPETEPVEIPGDDAINTFARPNWERKQAEKEASGKGTAEPYRPHRPASYLRKTFTAPAGRGRLYIKGRCKTMILGPAGENIYPESIESVINNMQFVQESLVVPEGTGLLALIRIDLEAYAKSLKIDLDQAREEAKKYVLSLRGQVNKELSAQNRIDAVELQEEDFERTATQKIKRFLYPKKKKEDGQ